VYQERKSRTSADFVDTWGDNTDHAITSIVSPTIFTNKSPGWSKLFQEVVLLFEGHAAGIAHGRRRERVGLGRHAHDSRDLGLREPLLAVRERLEAARCC
jgi:hypothetical protein